MSKRFKDTDEAYLLETYHKTLKAMDMEDCEKSFRIFTCTTLSMLFDRIKSLEELSPLKGHHAD